MLGCTTRCVGRMGVFGWWIIRALGRRREELELVYHVGVAHRRRCWNLVALQGIRCLSGILCSGYAELGKTSAFCRCIDVERRQVVSSCISCHSVTQVIRADRYRTLLWFSRSLGRLGIYIVAASSNSDLAFVPNVWRHLPALDFRRKRSLGPKLACLT